MSQFEYTQVEAVRVINDTEACPGCKQDAAQEFMLHYARSSTDEVTKFKARLLNNSGREPHTCH